MTLAGQQKLLNNTQAFRNVSDSQVKMKAQIFPSVCQKGAQKERLIATRS
jgi:hypothetical protein